MTDEKELTIPSFEINGPNSLKNVSKQDRKVAQKEQLKSVMKDVAAHSRKTAEYVRKFGTKED